ncbi:MAG: hypothetical protein AB7E47_09995 [Desulfovibrionaceae bacterium]
MTLLVTIFIAFLALALLAVVHYHSVQGLQARISKLLSEKEQLERKTTALHRQLDNLKLAEATLRDQLEALKTSERKAQANASSTNTPPPSGAATSSQANRTDRASVIGLMLSENALTQTAFEKVQQYKRDTRSDHTLEDLLIMLDLASTETVALYKSRVKNSMQ